MPVVAMQPDRQVLGAAVRCRIGLGVGPFAQRRLDEALDDAIIRYVIGGVLFVLLFFSLNGLMVSPSGTWGTGSTKVRAGRR